MLPIKIKDIEQPASIKAKNSKRKKWSQNTTSLLLTGDPLFTYDPTLSIQNKCLHPYLIKNKNHMFINYLKHHLLLNLKHLHPLQMQLLQGQAHLIPLKVPQLTKVSEKICGTLKIIPRIQRTLITSNLQPSQDTTIKSVELSS